MRGKRLATDEVKQVELDILIEFDRFCRENQLNYSLGEGTLIGAVRHKGFIPWDDDIDVLMPRKDYDKFISSYYSDRYSIVNASDNSIFPYFFARLTDNHTEIEFTDSNQDSNRTYYLGGVFIDILPIDNFPNSKDAVYRHERSLYPLFKTYRLKKRRGYLLNGVGLTRNVASLIFKVALLAFPQRLLRKCICKKLVKFNGQKTNYCGYWTNYWHHPWIFPSEVFDAYIDLEFEGKMFKAMAGYDTYLRCEYGEYMKLPPEEKQIAPHFFEAYWNTES